MHGTEKPEDIAPEPHIVGNQDDAIEPSHDIWFIGSGSGPVAKASLRSLSRTIAVASVQRVAQRTAIGEGTAGGLTDDAVFAQKTVERRSVLMVYTGI
jgi:ATP-dependent protease HslVU (ClpYQ) peptidase subunit